MTIKIFLKDVSLQNWGSYREKQTMQFSTDPDLNVTYIIGKNSCGKTKLFQAIKWAIFGEVEDLYGKINQKAKDSGEIFTTKIEVNFSTEHSSTGEIYDYSVTRSIRFKGVKQKGDVDVFINTFNSSNPLPTPHKEKDYNKMIDSFIPSGPREYFFLDGENLVNIFLSNIERVKNLAVEQSIIPRLREITAIIAHLTNDTISKVKKLTQKNRLLQKHYNTLEKERNIIQELEESISENKKFIQTLEEERNEIERNLSGVNKQAYEKRERINEEKSNLKEKKIKITKEIDSIFKEKGVQIILEDILKFCYDDLKEKKKQNKIPSIINSEVIDEIKQMDFCICGNKIGNQELQKLREWKENVSSGGIKDEAAIEFLSKISDEIQEIDEYKKILFDLKSDLLKINLEIREKEKEIKLLGSSDREVKNLIDKLRKITEKIKSLELDNRNSTEKIKSHNGKIKRTEKNIKKATVEIKRRILSGVGGSDPDLPEKIDQKENLRTFLENIQGVNNQLIEKVSDDIRKTIKEETSKKYSKFIWNPDEWKGIDISEDWQFYGIQKDGTKIISPELSKGQRHMLGIAFLSSLPGITELELPFLFDSPFGGISDEPVSNVGRFLPEIMQGTQIIMFVTDTEDNNVYPHIKNKIAKKYLLTFKDGKTTINKVPIE